MHLAKYYSEKHKMAYVILGHCDSFGKRADEVEYFEMETGIKTPARIEFNEIALGKWQNMAVIKFSLPFTPKIPSHSKQVKWQMLDDDKSLFELLRPKYRNEQAVDKKEENR